MKRRVPRLVRVSCCALGNEQYKSDQVTAQRRLSLSLASVTIMQGLGFVVFRMVYTQPQPNECVWVTSIAGNTDANIDKI